MENSKHILAAILDAGELMLKSGAEVSRVENTMWHMAKAYGFTKIDVYTIIYSIVVTVHDAEGNIETQTRRIDERDINMHRVERVNALSRRISEEVLSLEEFKQALEEIRNEKGYPQWLIFLIYGISAAAFTVFFGGGAGDAVAACIGGWIIRIVLLMGIKLKIQNIILNMLCSGVAGLIAVAMIKLGLGQSLDMILIGNIMLLIPGLAFTISLRDMIRGDLISGLLGLIEAVLKALAIAIGLAFVIWQFGGGL